MKTSEIEEVKRNSSIEVSELQATVRQLQGDLDDSSRRYSELQLVEVRRNHSSYDHILSLCLSVCLSVCIVAVTIQ
jgi:5-methylcytosine-specific restriction endonuclease McrBC regulatory subunit McrC